MFGHKFKREHLIRLLMMMTGVAGFFILWGGGLPLIVVTVLFGAWTGLTLLNRLLVPLHSVMIAVAVGLIGYGLWLVNVGAAQAPEIEQAVRFRGGLLVLSGLFAIIAAAYGLRVVLGPSE
jgi:hypothetical protein